MEKPKVLQIIEGKKGKAETVNAGQDKVGNRQRGQVTYNEGEKLYKSLNT